MGMPKITNRPPHRPASNPMDKETRDKRVVGIVTSNAMMERLHELEVKVARLELAALHPTPKET